MMSRACCFLALAIVFGLATTARAQREFDQVFLVKGGAAVRGQIPFDTGMTKNKVTVDMSGVPRAIDVTDIVRITFRDEPVDLTAARTAAIQRNYNQALTDLKKVDGQKIERDFIRQDVDYYRALCLCRLAMSEGGDKTAATTAMLSFVKSAPDSYHFYDAAEMLGDLAMTSGKWADAARYYGPISAAPWPDYQVRANIAMGRALVGEKKYEEAQERFKAVLGSELNTPEASKQKNQANVGRAVCLAETGKADEAITLLQDLINKNDPQDTALFARIYNALGRCYMKQNKPKDAVLALLHTDMLFYTDPDAHAESLYYLSKLWSEINKSDRAVAARNILKERYAGSVWATQE